MDVMKFFDLWEASTITLSDSEKARLINALIDFAHNAKNKEMSDELAKTDVHLFGRESQAFKFLCKAISEKSTYERTV